LNRTHVAFAVTPGRYLSFYACLFLLAMFLYRSEANQLISKIKGFKKNKTEEEKSKRELFSFFSKKFSSQDVDSEENHLVKFRDIIQYLNRYPLEWNGEIELEAQHPLVTDKLKAAIIDMEIDRSFPDFRSNNRFNLYVRMRFWKDKSVTDDFTSEEKRTFQYEINSSPELKDANAKLAELKAITGLYGAKKDKNEKEIEKLEKKLKDDANDPNPIKEKLLKRIQQNSLFTSYGRNQDRFMDMATRFLAETNYFGSDAKFKMYACYENSEQVAMLLELKQTLPKKEFDKLKFHQGKLVDFYTFANHKERYESWDTPFVIENNAIQVKLSFASGVERIVSIQRNLMVYLLEDALFTTKPDALANAGKVLLEKYYLYHQAEFTKSKQALAQTASITPDEKTAYKKILPKRLLHHYSPALQNNLPLHSTQQLLLMKTQEAEARYEKLLEKATAEGNYDDFVKRNKGKQYKLQFVRKAWQWMYFKESYTQQAEINGHHKRFNIERDEFNDFSRYMFAFDEVAPYKTYLAELLNKKGFFNNLQFKKLFDSGTSLNNLYVKTKEAYQAWLEQQSAQMVEPDKYSLANYESMFADQMFYINLSHFIAYLKAEGKLQLNEQGALSYKALVNQPYLLQVYYADKADLVLDKSFKKHYNNLQSAKLEDALLYEIALNYLKVDVHISNKAKNSVMDILNQAIVFDISNAQGHLYSISVPFNKIDSYVELETRKKSDELNYKGSSFIGNIDKYIELIAKEASEIDSWNLANRDNKKGNPHKLLVPICKQYEKQKTLSFDQLQKIYAHLLGSSVKFTRIAMEIEQYFICKPNKQGKVVLNGEIDKNTKCYLIRFENTGVPSNYFGTGQSSMRNKAFHFSIPQGKSYDFTLIDIEKKFVQNEIQPLSITTYADIPQSAKRVCTILMDVLHNDFFGKERDGKKKRHDAEQRYVNELIMK